MAGRGIVIKIEGDGESARQALAMVREQMQETAEKAKESGGLIETAFEEAKKAFDWVVVYEAMHEAFDKVADLAKETFELGEQMVQASQKTGLSVESLSVLKYAAGELGTSFDSLVTGVGRMQKNIADASSGNKKLASEFQEMGLDAKALSSDVNGSETAFHRFIDTVAATTNVSARNQLVMDMMGRAGLEQIPVLIELSQHWDEYKDRAQAAGVVLSEKTAKSLEEVQQQLNDVKARVEGAGVAFVEGLIPALGQLTDVIREGKNDRNELHDWGNTIGKDLAFVAEVAYSAASALEFMFGAIEGGGATEMSRKDLEAAKQLAQQAQEFHAIAFGLPRQADVNKYTGDIHPSDLDQWASQGSGAKPFVPPPPPGPKNKGGSGDHIADAAAALVAEQAKAAADAQRNADAVALAQLEEHHKEMIGSEQQYLADKLKLQLDEIDAEMKGLQGREASLEALYQKQHADKSLKRDKDGNSAEELRTMKELEQVWDQMDAAAAKYKETVAANSAAAFAANQTAELAGLRAAAELEKQRNDGITAQIALLERETQIEVQKAAAQGASADTQAQIRANGQLLEQKLRIADVDRQIAQTEAEFNAAAKAIEDRAAKGQITKLQAERQLNALHQQEVALLQSLVQQYDALAATLGGPFLEKAQQLHTALSEMSTPDKSKEPDFGKTIAQSMTRMADTLVAQSIRGKTSFHEMVKEIETDAAELALKLLMMKMMGGGQDGQGGSGGGSGGSGGGSGWGGALSNIFQKMFSGMGGGSSSGGDGGGGGDGGDMPEFATGTDNYPGGPSIVGEQGPELWTPPGGGKGGSITPNGVLSKIAESGGGGKTPNITTNVINQSSQPVTVQESQTDYDSQAHEFVQSVVLKDLSNNGPIRMAMGGMG